MINWPTTWFRMFPHSATVTMWIENMVLVVDISSFSIAHLRASASWQNIPPQYKYLVKPGNFDFKTNLAAKELHDSFISEGHFFCLAVSSPLKKQWEKTRPTGPERGRQSRSSCGRRRGQCSTGAARHDAGAKQRTGGGSVCGNLCGLVLESQSCWWMGL